MSSTNLLGDIGTVLTNGPSTLTKAAAIAAAGPIQDYVGNCRQAQLKLEEVDVNLTKVLTVLDSGDGIKTGVTAVLHLVTGASAPSSTAIADLKTAIATGPSATSKANAIAAAGPIMDIVGNLTSALFTLEVLNNSLTYIKNVTSASDDSTNRNLILGMLAVLV